jgi:ketosteroid isomerase-like protein
MDAVQTFERWHKAHESVDTVALGAVLHPDAVVRSLFRSTDVRGRESAVSHFTRTLSTFPDLRMPLRSLPAANPDGVVFAEVGFCGTFTGELTWDGRRHDGTGRSFDLDGVVVLHTADGWVTSVATLFDRDVWLHQIGIV